MTPKRIAQVIRERHLQDAADYDACRIDSDTHMGARHCLWNLAADFSRIFKAMDARFDVEMFKRSCSYELACRECKGTGTVARLDQDGMVEDYRPCQYCYGYGWID